MSHVEGIPYSNPTTSLQAAESQQGRHSRDEVRIIHALLDYPGGATCDALERHLHMAHQTCSARLRGLVKKGLVRSARYPDGSPKYERTVRGRRAIVWEASPMSGETLVVPIPEGWRALGFGEQRQDQDKYFLEAIRGWRWCEVSIGRLQGYPGAQEVCIRRTTSTEDSP